MTWSTVAKCSVVSVDGSHDSADDVPPDSLECLGGIS